MRALRSTLIISLIISGCTGTNLSPSSNNEMSSANKVVAKKLHEETQVAVKKRRVPQYARVKLGSSKNNPTLSYSPVTNATKEQLSRNIALKQVDWANLRKPPIVSAMDCHDANGNILHSGSTNTYLGIVDAISHCGSIGGAYIEFCGSELDMIEAVN